MSDTTPAPGPLGWISPRNRTPAQWDAHINAIRRMPRFALPAPTVPKGTKVLLTNFWKDPAVVADVGYEFNGFHQLTGSCVGASAGNAIFTVAAGQRLFELNPTVAFVPWWPFSYGRTRFNEGDHSPGEGAIDSVMAQTLIREGVMTAATEGLPAFDKSDGLFLTSELEMQWSDGDSAEPMKYLALAKQHPLGQAALCNSTADIKAGILNGYPNLNGCDNYIGKGSVKGSGADAYVVGRYDGQGGHSTCYLGYWEHPNDGPLYLYSNQWPTSTYPKDPAGAGRCCVWTPEAEVDKLFRTGGQGESFNLSHLNWFPARPEVLSYYE